jgi:predicted amidohydrolase
MAKDELSIAALQLNSQAEVAQNLETCRRLLARAASRGAEVVVLPENFAFFGPEADKQQIAESLSDGPITTALVEMAREFRVALVAGGFPELSGDQQRPHNSLLVIGADGSRLGTYRKIHLFDVELGSSGSYSESAATLAGKAPLVVEVAGFKLGLSICYDLRFPELYRALSEQGAEVILVPAAFTLHTGKDHWHVLLRARAIESQAYVVAAAQHGTHPGSRNTYGHALIADPWGTVIAEASDGVGLVSATLERSRLESIRRNLPSLKHRKLGLAKS